jgi:uncharacterized repeat protein (TIGR01451 family)
MLQSRWLSKYLLSLFAGSGLVLIVATLLVATVRSAPFVACTVTAGSGTYPTIQAAIDDLSCDPINVPAGTYPENVVITRSLTLQGAGKTSTVIDGGGAERGVTIDGSGITVYLNDLHITNGNATAAAIDFRFGGGILVTNDATLHGTNLQIDQNLASSDTAGFGGGVAINTGSGYLTGTTIYSNTANQRSGVLTGNGRGGGLYVNDGILHLANSQVVTNLAAYRADSAESAAGGGMFVAADTQIYLKDNIWQGNIARGSNSEICDLTTCVSGLDTEGGGAVSVNFPTGTSDVTISGDTFIGNIANDVNPLAGDNSGRGGAISLNTSNTGGQITATLMNVVMSQNIAATKSNGVGEEGRGGAIYARHTDITIHRANIYNNQAAATGNGSGGGLYTREPLVNNSVEIINSVLAGNLAAGIGEGAQIYINHVSSPANNVTKIVHSTLADDALNSHEALFYHSTDASDSLAITNTIVASHAVGIQNVNVTGRATARYMLFFGNTDNHPSPGAVAFPDMTGWVAGDPDPRFVDPPGNDYHILADSPAIDAGTDEGVLIDIDGDVRPQGAQVDIGADETSAYLTITKSGPTTVTAPEPITYTLYVTNSGTYTASNLVITDAIPGGASYVSGGTPVGNVVSWSVASLAANNSTQATFVVTALTDVTNDDYRVSADYGISATGAVSVVTTVYTPYLTIRKSGPYSVTAGYPITYTLTVTNSGSGAASNLVITDTIPANAYYVSGGTLVGNVVSWSVASLAANNSTQATFVVTATQTVNNNDYRVSSDGGFYDVGLSPVVTVVDGAGQEIYLPMVLK